MNTAKTYQDSDGKDCTLLQMVRREPEWAASRIQAGEAALDTLESIQAWDRGQYIANGGFTLPQDLRERISPGAKANRAHHKNGEPATASRQSPGRFGSLDGPVADMSGWDYDRTR